MRGNPESIVLRRAVLGTALALALCVTARPGDSPLAASQSPSSPAASDEVRAIWVTRTTMSTPEAIQTMVRSAAAAGFNTLLVQVRARGDAYFTGGPEPRAIPGGKAAWDPLDLALQHGHKAGLRVHAWMNANLVSSAVTLPSAASHVVNRHPEWLMVPRALASEMSVLKAGTPLYRQKLSRWVRSQAGVEGLYLSPIPRDAARYTIDVIADVAARYPVDGVHLDYVRYPNAEFDYSRAALTEFRAHLLEGRTQAERRERVRRGGDDLLGYPSAYPEEWREFRRARLTAMVSGVRKAVRRARPQALLTAAVLPNVTEAVDHRLQEWPSWLEHGLLDAVCPMAYATNPATFTAQVTAARGGAAGRPLWAGIGAFHLTRSQAVDNIRTARRLGADGIVLFSYDSLIAPRREAHYLSRLGRAVFR